MDYIVAEKLNEEIPRYERNSPLSEEIIGRIVNFWETILRKKVWIRLRYFILWKNIEC